MQPELEEMRRPRLKGRVFNTLTESLAKDFIRAQASKAQGPIDFQRIIIFFYFFFIFFFYSTIRVLLRALTCSKTLENSHTRWNLLASGRHRGWDPGVAQGLYGAP